jgi:hypothetical protein
LKELKGEETKMKRRTIYGMIGGLAAILLVVGAIFLVSTYSSREEEYASSDYEEFRSLEEPEEVNNEEAGNEESPFPGAS